MSNHKPVVDLLQSYLKKTQHLLSGEYTVDITISPAILGHFESPKQADGVGVQRVIGTFRVFNLLKGRT